MAEKEGCLDEYMDEQSGGGLFAPCIELEDIFESRFWTQIWRLGKGGKCCLCSLCDNLWALRFLQDFLYCIFVSKVCIIWAMHKQKFELSVSSNFWVNYSKVC